MSKERERAMAGRTTLPTRRRLLLLPQRQRQRLTVFCLFALITACRTAWDATAGSLFYLPELLSSEHHKHQPWLHHRRRGRRQASPRETTYLPREDEGRRREDKASNKDNHENDPFAWLTERDIDLGMDTYAAAWYMSRKTFLGVDVSHVRSLEGACFAVYRDRDHLVRMSLDYLDWAVEHGSQWWKTLGCPHDPQAVNLTTSTYRAYVHKHLHNRQVSDSNEEPPSSILHRTIALVAFSQLRADPLDLDTTTDLEGAEDRNREITTTSLAATLASLVRIGFGRILVVGHAHDDDAVVTEAFRYLVQDGEGDRVDNAPGPRATVLGSELAFVRPTPDMMMTEGGDDVKDNVPKGALAGLQHAFQGRDANWTRRWLGHDTTAADDWEHVYYTEQDSVLHTRDSALPHLRRALDDGLIVVPHRLQPIPHRQDVPATLARRDAFPSLPSFPTPRDVRPHDHCCDAQDRRVYDPETIEGYEACGAPWWQCGFSDTNGQLGNHSRLARYGLIRLMDGTGVAVIAGSAHGRRCVVSPEPCRYRDATLESPAEGIE